MNDKKLEEVDDSVRKDYDNSSRVDSGGVGEEPDNEEDEDESGEKGLNQWVRDNAYVDEGREILEDSSADSGLSISAQSHHHEF